MLNVNVEGLEGLEELLLFEGFEMLIGFELLNC